MISRPTFQKSQCPLLIKSSGGNKEISCGLVLNVDPSQQLSLLATHTVAIWTFPFHQNSVKKSDNFQDLTSKNHIFD